MKKYGDTLRLSASDLAGHLGCRHLTALNTAAAEGRLKRPIYKDDALDALIQRGLLHEKAYVEHLRRSGASVAELPEDDGPDEGFQRACDAMRAGADVITQAWLVKDSWYGRADILRRVDRRSDLGSWSYQVEDTKLARETRAGTVLQLSLYSEIIADVQGVLPEAMSVVSPGDPFREERLRVLDYSAYYRLIKSRVETVIPQHRDAGAKPTTYPDPVPHCDVCSWWPNCDKRRRADDHLSLVAGISSLQRTELVRRGVATLEGLAKIKIPLDPRPDRGSQEAFARVHHQARIQLEGRIARAPRYELIAPLPGHGLALLPEPDVGDVFLDLEGDPFVADTGREYLFGWVTIGNDETSAYRCRWAMTAKQEKASFEALVDELIATWDQHRNFHIYHYAAYEPSALKRLMGRYATREDEVDRMLRAGKFVDLYSAVRNGVRASVERYSIKDLEIFYGYTREIGLRDAGPNRQAVEVALELGNVAALETSTLDAVEQYNRDDCVSARKLRDWLEERRAELVADGKPVVRPVAPVDEGDEELNEKRRKVRALEARLMTGVPLELAERTQEQQACWLLAQLLEWHLRERKSQWWEYFRLLDLTPEDLLDERAAISGLRFEKRLEVPKRKNSRRLDRYTFPAQETAVRVGANLRDLAGHRFGEVEAIDPLNRTVDIRTASALAETRPEAVFEHDVIGADAQEESLYRLGEWVSEHGIDNDGPFRAARDLLLQRSPRIEGVAPGPLVDEAEDIIAGAKRLVSNLRESVLPVQGPPGAGKTFIGARMICELVRQGKKVGVSAVGHKVIRNLLDEVLSVANTESIAIKCVRKVGEKSEDTPSGIEEVETNPEVLEALASGEAQVGAGTAWLWSRTEFRDSVDVLFIDEAGQMSLADVVAAAQAGASLVLLGDPQQLEQPMQGSHPEGTSVPALEHLLEGHNTISPDRGLFLPETWRLHPSLCEFTSELFYDDRLRSRPGLDQQLLDGDTSFAGAGLWFVPVEHEGNQNCSPEEVEAVASIVAGLLNGKVTWIDKDRVRNPLARDQILIVAPYNLHVTALQERLPGMRIGTVDKFQGQQAPIVIYSMATSSPENAPRGMEFLYSASRLNVATSRAQTACMLVANPRLFEPNCRTPRQMQLANAFCRFLEMAKVVVHPRGGT